MEIKNKKALVLGGAGLVGRAICRHLIMEDIDSIIICSLFKHEAEEFKEQLGKEYPQINFQIEWGDVFLRWEHKDVSRADILGKQEYRDVFLHDVLNPLNRKILTESAFYNLLNKYKPDIVIDAMNTASILAYQNIFGSSKETYAAIHNIDDKTHEVVEKLLCTQYIPQLIRHVQIFQQAMLENETRVYLKIGTCGTGGMGLNIPYTHSEDRPSQMLLAKSAVAGAHSLLLFLMARTPGGPIIKELKPAAAIAWKKVGYGPVKKKGKPILMEDVQLNDALSLEGNLSKEIPRNISYLTQNDQPRNLEAPYIDTGENGLFSLGEFETLTDEGQMEFITPEEIAQNAIWEIKGGNTGTDIVAALDNSVLGPTYRAGYMRHGAIKSLRELVEKTGTESVAFELLGPPRLSKLLYEAFLLKRVFKTFNGVLETSPENMTQNVESLVKKDEELRSSIVSIGIPILLSSNQLLRGQRMAIPADVPGDPKVKFEITSENINNWATDGWVDLRIENMKAWQQRFVKIQDMINSIPEDDSSSGFAKGVHYWNVENGDIPISISKLASWIFIHEDQGKRMK
ncbi:short-chain dehydrogenase [bacterium]|nr:short-chain dehydrogenase [bacterium]